VAGGGSRGGGEAGGREARWEEKDLLAWLRRLRPHGTLVLIYNLWETDQGHLELDLFSDLSDVRTRPVPDPAAAAAGAPTGAAAAARAASLARGAEVRDQHATTATPTT